MSELIMTTVERQQDYVNVAQAASDAFYADPELETYIVDSDIEDEEFICLRYGAERDCVRIYKLDKIFTPIQFNNIISRP